MFLSICPFLEFSMKWYLIQHPIEVIIMSVFVVLIQDLATWARNLDPTLLEITGADLILTHRDCYLY